MKPTPRLSFANIFFPLWLVLCIVFFFIIPGRSSYIHWSTLQEISLLPAKLGRINGWQYYKDILLSIFGISFYTLANLSAGFTVLKLTRFSHWRDSLDSISLRLAFLGTAFLVGHGVLSLVFMALALPGWLNPVITGLILILGFPLGLMPVIKTVLAWIKAWHIGGFLPNKKDRIFLALGITILITTLLYSSARLSYDSVAVYFSDAKLTALTGKIHYFTRDSFVVSIFQTAIQFSAIIQLFGDQTARLFSWVHGMVIILFSILIAEKVGLSRQARLYLGLLLVTSTAFIDLFGDGKVELASFSPIMAAIYWIIAESKTSTSHKSLLVLIGFLLGLSMVARPYNVILAGGFTMLFYLQCAFWGSWKTEASPIKRLRYSALWIGLGMLGVGAYHLIANWSLLGSPFAMITNTAVMTPSNWQWAIDPDQLLLIRLLYPLASTYLNTPQSLGTISPLLIGFIPLLVIKDVRNKMTISREVYTLLIISAIILMLWIFFSFTVMEIRYTFFLWIFIFMPFAEVMATAFEKGAVVIQKTSTVMTFLLLGFIALRVVFIAIDTYSPIDEQGNPQCSDSRFCEYLKSINLSALPGDRVLTLSAFRYYLRTDLFACSTNHEEYQQLRATSTKGNLAFWEEVYRQGYQYIAYENDYTTRHLQLQIVPSPENAPAWIDLEPIFGEPGDLQIAYKINVSDPPTEIESSCQKNSSGIWEVSHLFP